MVAEDRGAVDGGNFGRCIGGEIEFMIDEKWARGACGEAKVASVGTGTEGDDLFFLRKGLGEEKGREIVNCGRADICAWKKRNSEV